MASLCEGGSVKLNLGSGCRNIVGYTNVDLDPRADVHADIRKLPFDDESADEIMAIHVIEHFYRWEVEDVLKEWARVLKPGGKLVLECPDLAKIVRNLVNGGTDQITVWGLYGDPRYRSVIMTHKWAYTFQTLKAAVEESGFRDAEPAPPQWHFAVRDMRLEARK
jgi:predicted SAM-dependent methyltransferase